MARVGHEIGRSGSVTVSQEQIARFADVTRDGQEIHLDSKAARDAGFAGPVAHGFLTLSLLSAFAYDAVPRVEGQTASVNYGFDRVRFITPVVTGDEIAARFILEGVEERADGSLMLVLDVAVSIPGSDAPVLSALWRILILF
ncbi:MaoC/PaaZ C-terminal domain-containing protein [uncultured Roseobacter sp.]|uniref:MaoC/PaaZ C-terminal domain-containing protein n=1 Tax=uncultured Roseobacter sp. TaxID=114847 RepID=UPI0026154122|nr:MaoC/PaaZ C-terminal domain-containing protein [uncultured Roseobacter sp.]